MPIFSDAADKRNKTGGDTPTPVDLRGDWDPNEFRSERTKAELGPDKPAKKGKKRPERADSGGWSAPEDDAWASYDDKDDWLADDASSSARPTVDARAHGRASAVPSKAVSRLVGLQGSDTGREFYLTHKECVVGRDPRGNVVLTDVSVSREHARIFCDEDRFLVVDQRSGNGTFVNGQRIDRARLKHGDEVAFGSALFRFLMPGQTFQGQVAGAPILPPESDDHFAPEAVSSATRYVLMAIILLALSGVVFSLYVRFSSGMASNEARRKLVFAYYTKGVDAFRSHRWRDAETQFQSVLALDATHERSKAYLDTIPNEETAQSQLEEARASHRRGDWQRTQSLATPLLETTFHDGAVELLRDVEQEVDRRTAKANSELQAGHFAEAQRLLQFVDSMRPGRPSVMVMLARSRQHSAPKVVSKAPPAAVTSVAPKPVVKAEVPSVAVAVRVLGQGKISEAEAMLASAKGDNAEYVQGIFQRFQETYQRGLEASNNQEAAAALRDLAAARAYAVRMGVRPGALLAGLDAKLSTLYYAQGMAFFAADKLPEALASFLATLKISPSHAGAQRKLGEIEERAQELYDEGASAKNLNPAAARAKLKQVMQLVSPDTLLYRKAKQRLDALP